MIGQRKLLTPKPGLVIRDPGNRGKPLPEKGRVVVIDEFWSRRIADGDVVVADPPARFAVAAADQPVALGEPDPAAPAAEGAAVEESISHIAATLAPQES